MLDINTNKLNKIINDFYNITGVMIGAYDIDFKPLSTPFIPHCSLCTEVRKHQELADRCYKCDIDGIKKCTNSRATQIYNCHMGLVEAVTPIYSNNVVVGYILIGQMLDGKDIGTIKQDIINMQEDVDKEKLLAAVDEVPVLSNDKIESIVSLMHMCTKYLMVERIVNIKSSLLSKSIEQYIEDHIEDDIGINDICDAMHISRSKLYEVSTEFFKMGITDYIRLARLERAKLYLKNEDFSVSQIAREVGFDDANYFSKIFKKYTGQTPLEYKRS